MSWAPTTSPSATRTSSRCTSRTTTSPGAAGCSTRRRSSRSNGNLYPVIDSSSYLLYAPIPALSQGSDLKTQSVFVNDTWKLGNHLSFNLGVRWDKNDATDAGRAPRGERQPVQPPALGLVRPQGGREVPRDGQLRPLRRPDPGRDRGQRRHLGRLTRQLLLLLAGRRPSTARAAAGGTCTPTAQVLQQMFGALGVTRTGMFPTTPAADIINLPGVNQLIISPLKSPNANEYSVGFGGAVGSNFVYRVDASPPRVQRLLRALAQPGHRPRLGRPGKPVRPRGLRQLERRRTQLHGVEHLALLPGGRADRRRQLDVVAHDRQLRRREHRQRPARLPGAQLPRVRAGLLELRRRATSPRTRGIASASTRATTTGSVRSPSPRGSSSPSTPARPTARPAPSTRVRTSTSGAARRASTRPTAT